MGCHPLCLAHFTQHNYSEICSTCHMRILFGADSVPLHRHHSLVDGHLGCFQFGAIRNKASINFPAQVSKKFMFRHKPLCFGHCLFLPIFYSSLSSILQMCKCKTSLPNP